VSILTHSSHRAIRLHGRAYVGEKDLGEYGEGEVSIGPFSVIMPGTRIGKGCVVSAHSCVRGDVPDFAVVHGCIPIVSNLPANRERVKHGEKGLLCHDGLSLSEIGDMERNGAAVAERNRRITAERALFPERMRSIFIPRLFDLAGLSREGEA